MLTCAKMCVCCSAFKVKHIVIKKGNFYICRYYFVFIQATYRLGTDDYMNPRGQLRLNGSFPLCLHRFPVSCFPRSDSKLVVGVNVFLSLCVSPVID